MVDHGHFIHAYGLKCCGHFARKVASATTVVNFVPRGPYIGRTPPDFLRRWAAIAQRQSLPEFVNDFAGGTAVAARTGASLIGYHRGCHSRSYRNGYFSSGSNRSELCCFWVPAYSETGTGGVDAPD